jgi:hypothetical protein
MPLHPSASKPCSLQDAGGKVLDRAALLQQYSDAAEEGGSTANPAVSLLLSKPGATDAVREILKQASLARAWEHGAIKCKTALWC